MPPDDGWWWCICTTIRVPTATATRRCRKRCSIGFIAAVTRRWRAPMPSHRPRDLPPRLKIRSFPVMERPWTVLPGSSMLTFSYRNRGFMGQKYVNASISETKGENSLPILEGTLGPPAVDIQMLYSRDGLLAYDPGFRSTAA